MAKKVKPTDYQLAADGIGSVLNEPMLAAAYTAPTAVPPFYGANYSKYTFNWFKQIALLVPFTQKEWSNILHLSERTLQRYALANAAFDGIYVDRILQIESLIQLGLQTFASPDAFYHWLKQEKQVMGQLLSFESLYSYQGIQALIAQINRIQCGVYA